MAFSLFALINKGFRFESIINWRNKEPETTFMGKSETNQFVNPPVNIFVSKNHAIEKVDFLLRQKSKSFLTAIASHLTTGIWSWYIRS